MSNEFITNIEKDIKEILAKETNEKNTNDIAVTQKIFELSQRFEHHTAPAFLNAYTELFNESSINKLKPKDISRILTSSLPFNLGPFISIFQKNPQDIKPLLDSFENFAKKFPITHSASSSYYSIPMFLSALLFGNNQDLQRTIDINPSFFQSAKFLDELPKVINTAVSSKNKQAVNTLYERYPHSFDYKIVNNMIKNQYDDIELISKIVHSPSFTKTETQDYVLNNGHKINSTFSGYLAISTLYTQSNYDLTLFKKFNKEKPLSLNETIVLDTGNSNSPEKNSLRFVEILSKTKNQDNVLTMFKELYNNKPFNEVETILFFRHYLTAKDPSLFIHACSDPFFKTVINNPAFSSSLLNRTEIMKNFYEMEKDPKYNQYLERNNIFLRPAISFFYELANSYPEDFKKLNLHEPYFLLENDNKENQEINVSSKISLLKDESKNLVLKSLYENIENISKETVSSYDKIAIENLIDLGLVHKKIEIEKTRGFMFSKTISKENITLEWNSEAIANIIKNNKKQKKKTTGMIDVFDFLVGEDLKPLEVSFIEGIVDDQTRNVAKNILLMVHSYKELEIKSNTIIPSEEMYFLDNRVGIMLSRLVKTYDDYKHYDQNDAQRTLHAQLLMLQNRTSQAIHTVMLDDKQRLEQASRINDNLLSKPINPHK